MFSTTQKTCYVVPTNRAHEHHSQAYFDPLQSLVVKPLGPKKATSSLYKDCWTQEFSAPRLAQKSAKPILIRESTEHSTFEPWAKNSKECLPVPTTTLPKRGLIKLTAVTDKAGRDFYDSHHISNSPFRLNRPKRSTTSYHEKKPFALTRAKTYQVGLHEDITVDDLRLAINSKYPETNGIAFSRATTSIKETSSKVDASYRLTRDSVVSQEKLVSSYLKSTEPKSYDTLGVPKSSATLQSPPNSPQSSTRTVTQVPIGVPTSALLDPLNVQEGMEGSLPERHYSQSIDSVDQ